MKFISTTWVGSCLFVAGVEMNWLNFMLAKMWPHIHETLKQVVAKDLEPKIKDPL